MGLRAILLALVASAGIAACSSSMDSETNNDVVWQKGTDIEAFWLAYAESKGGLTWGKSSEYPEYEKVKEGDTFIVEVAQGPCLMEFFHERWRRANDVRRWHESVNEYGGCPYVFD